MHLLLRALVVGAAVAIDESTVTSKAALQPVTVNRQQSSVPPAVPPLPTPPPPPPLPPPSPPPFPDTLPIKSFLISYTLPLDTHPDHRQVYQIVGWEPAVGGPYPVYIHAGGGGDPLVMEGEMWGQRLPEDRFGREMAGRGFVAAMVEVPDRVGMTCNGTNLSLVELASGMFTYRGPGDNHSGALATMCRRDLADCSQGIAMHGLSVSGMLVRMVPRYAVGVTAVLVWSAGVRMPYGYSCCGVLSGRSSCCNANDTPGGTPIPCITDEQVSQYLPKSRRRLIMASHDTMYGDYECQAGCADMVPPNCTYNASRIGAAIDQARQVSGYQCGSTDSASNATHRVNCLREDGSGFYIPSIDDVGARRNHIMQGHNFHLITDDYNPNIPPQHATDYNLNPNFLATSDPWGFMASFKWLAETARR